jgi:hypothetical protein
MSLETPITPQSRKVPKFSTKEKVLGDMVPKFNYMMHYIMTLVRDY